MNYKNITAKEAKDLLNTNKNTLLIDVRTTEEWQDKHFCNAHLIPLSEITLDHIISLCDNLKQQKEIDESKPVGLVFYCAAGVRSLKAIDKLFGDEDYNPLEQQYNFTIYNLKGGIASCKVWL